MLPSKQTLPNISMNDARIRQALHSRVIRYHHDSEKAMVIDELGLHHGQARIDIAVINGELSGFEIKSELDNLSRLHSQVDSYSSVFEKLTLVVAKKFLDPSLDIIPDWWGVIVADRGPRGGVHFERVRSNSRNNNVEPYALAMLLWRNEVIELLRSIGYTGQKLKGPRRYLYSHLVSALSLAEIQSTVCTVLKSRENWRDREPLS